MLTINTLRTYHHVYSEHLQHMLNRVNKKDNVKYPFFLFEIDFNEV